jgi:hypothetical protein
MAGLSNFLTDSQQTQTTMPGWYDAAQQGIVSQGNTAMANAPTMAQTTAQGAVNTLQGAQNPFNQAQSTLQQISSGAANPWITDASGQVTPDTSTAMGGLFQAQKQQLNQLLPSQYEAPVQAGAIGSGQFGSLRGQTAVDKARADAFMNLNAQQLQAALTNQQTGATAASQMGNVGQQGINAAMNVGIAQQNAPFRNLSNYSNLVGGLQAPTTVTSQKQLGGLGQINAIGNLTTGLLSGLGLTAGGLLFGSPATATSPATSGPLGYGGKPGASAPGGGTGGGGGGTGGGGIINGGGISGGTSGTGDQGAQNPYNADGTPNPNYDVYADPNATQDMIDAQNAANQNATSPAYDSNGNIVPIDNGNYLNPNSDPYGIPYDDTGYVPDNTTIDYNDYNPSDFG